MDAGDSRLFGVEESMLQECPIDPGWIIEGAPIARARLLSRSVDGAASTFIWECTPGTFHWHFDIDETIYLLEGSVIVRDDAGAERRLTAGDLAFFRKGTHAVWRVETHVRKLAFCHNPLPNSVVTAKRVARRLLEALGLRAPAAPALG
jgi:uncharacterized cupin superfamily protein